MLLKTRLSNAAPVAMRVALGAGFLSAVADRFGLWGPSGTPGVGWGEFAKFLQYTGTLLPFLPTKLVPVAGWAATVVLNKMMPMIDRPAACPILRKLKWVIVFSVLKRVFRFRFMS